MKTASVSQLKAHLSKYLRMARRGSEVQILDRGLPIARLVGCQGAGSGAEAERLDRLVRAGILRRGTGDLGWLLVDPPLRVPGADLSQALAEDREERA